MAVTPERRDARWLVRSSLTHFRVRSLDSSAPPSQGRPSATNEVGGRQRRAEAFWLEERVRPSGRDEDELGLARPRFGFER